MAISRSVRPELILHGTVERDRELKRKSDNEVYGAEFTVAQDSGARVAVTIYNSGLQSMPRPKIGDYVAWVVSVEESRDYGAQLGFEREAWSELDKIASASGAKA